LIFGVFGPRGSPRSASLDGFVLGGGKHRRASRQLLDEDAARQVECGEGRQRRGAPTCRAEQQLSGRAFLDTDDYTRVEERIDAAAELRRSYAAVQDLPEPGRRLLELSRWTA